MADLDIQIAEAVAVAVVLDKLVLAQVAVHQMVVQEHSLLSLVLLFFMQEVAVRVMAAQAEAQEVLVAVEMVVLETKTELLILAAEEAGIPIKIMALLYSTVA